MASNNVNYEILLKAQGNLEKKKQDDERNKIAAEKAKKDALNYESTKKALEKLVPVRRRSWVSLLLKSKVVRLQHAII